MGGCVGRIDVRRNPHIRAVGAVGEIKRGGAGAGFGHLSQLMQMRDGYLDGHHGAWLMEPEEQAAVLDAFWRDGWHIHVHVNGDHGLDVLLDIIDDAMQRAELVIQDRRHATAANQSARVQAQRSNNDEQEDAAFKQALEDSKDSAVSVEIFKKEHAAAVQSSIQVPSM